jgi:hypothetical protein
MAYLKTFFTVLLHIFYSRDFQMVGRDPKVGRGTRISNIRLYESSKIETLEVGRDQIKIEN